MQASVPELMGMRDETEASFEMYGCQAGDGGFASNCILARRLAERGVRFIQLYHPDWDHHSLLRKELPLRAAEVEQAKIISEIVSQNRRGEIVRPITSAVPRGIDTRGRERIRGNHARSQGKSPEGCRAHREVEKLVELLEPSPERLRSQSYRHAAASS